MICLEHTICKKFRKIFKNVGFGTYLVNDLGHLNYVIVVITK
jgi:hypothetical protein